MLIAATRREDLPDDPVAIARAAFVELGLSSTEPQGAQARERWQSLNALVGLIEKIVESTPGIDLNGVLGSCAGALPISRPQPWKALRWLPCTPPRAWNGTLYSSWG